MAHEDFLGVTGNGRLTLATPTVIGYLTTRVTTLGARIDQRSLDQPQRLMHSGWLALQYLDSGTGDYVVTHYRYIEFQNEDIGLNDPNAYAEYLFHQLPLDAVYDIRVSW
jgi:hypothetical protein